MKFAQALMLVALSAHTLRGQEIRVAHDPRAEVIGILFRVAGAPDFSNGAQPAYNHHIDSTFAPFRAHPVFTEINRLRRQNGLSLSAVTSMAPQLTDATSFTERSAIDAPSSTLSGAWKGGEARTFLSYARDFARAAPLAAFLSDNRPLYDTATVRLKRLVDGVHAEWFRKFFGEPPGDVFIVSPLLVNAGGNFAADFMNGSMHERYAFIGVTLVDAKGYPAIAPDVRSTVVHEFSHSFVNHVVDREAPALRPSGEVLFRAVEPSMRGLAYTSWPTMFNESVVRATVIRYLMDNDGNTAAAHELSLQRGLGFVWMNELVALLGDYASHRSTYHDFASFMPRVVQYYNGLVPRLDRVIADFESHRPVIVSASIKDSAPDVNAKLDSIVIHFNHPVDAIIELVGDHGGGTPELTSAKFNRAHTTLTLGVKLEADRQYVLPLGPGAFVGRDGYPLTMFVLHFHTGRPGPSL